MKYLNPKHSKTFYINVFPPKHSRNILHLIQYHRKFRSLFKEQNEMFLASYISLWNWYSIICTILTKVVHSIHQFIWWGVYGLIYLHGTIFFADELEFWFLAKRKWSVLNNCPDRFLFFQVAQLGCKAFALLFDDIEPEMCKQVSRLNQLGLVMSALR